MKEKRNPHVVPNTTIAVDRRLPIGKECKTPNGETPTVRLTLLTGQESKFLVEECSTCARIWILE